MELGAVGVWTSYRQIGEDSAGEAARLVQEAGIPAGEWRALAGALAYQPGVPLDALAGALAR